MFSETNFKFMEWLGKNGLKSLLKDLLNIYDKQLSLCRHQNTTQIMCIVLKDM